eukprot:TRINITY_DN4140_c0_g1_i3.p1 TRINITY_DN4140_c0_g1~~TRINITY_DN4140_c0_g1_i3.p1  ORF type:complete len:464 (-),score=60.70 TRINITY_DN4140_c0_g1_i3:14-1405(-)
MNHQLVRNETIDVHVLRRYEIVRKIGSGVYGIVWECIHKRRKKTYALKKIFGAFQNATDAQRTFREIMLLQELSGHSNIITLEDVIKADNDKDIYLVFPYMQTDLHAAIRVNILQEVHKRFITYQLLKAIKYMHSGNVLHRDMKPSNLLLNAECLLRVADFGLARCVDQKDDKMPILTDYIATRWYRAPEILLGSNKYTKGVDMWSIGCILGEILLGKPLFPGTSTINQLERIIEIIGFPSPEDIDSIETQFTHTMISSLSNTRQKSITSLFPSASPEAINLLLQLLKFNPHKRINAEDALAHPYVAQFHDVSMEPVLSHPITIPISDNTKFKIADYRNKLYEDILAKKRERKEKERSEKKKRAERASSDNNVGSKGERLTTSTNVSNERTASTDKHERASLTDKVSERHDRDEVKKNEKPADKEKKRTSSKRKSKKNKKTGKKDGEHKKEIRRSRQLISSAQ